jgi:hypothetical protein
MRAVCASAIAVFAISSIAAVAAEHPPAFRTDVLPVLTRAGCNAGACHGAASGPASSATTLRLTSSA